MNHPAATEHKAAEATPKTTAQKAPDLTPPVKTNGAQKLTADGKDAKVAKEPKAPKAPKEPKPERVSNFKKVYPDTAKIVLLTPEGKNPKRPGSEAHGRFNAYGAGGVTVADALKAGATYADLSWDVGHGFIKVEAVAA